METEAGSQAKANTAEINAMNYTKSFGIGGTTVKNEAVDLNSIGESGLYYAAIAALHKPENLSGYLLHFNASAVSAAKPFIANFPGSPAYTRRKTSNTWESWTKLETSVGAQAKVNTHEQKTNNPHKTDKGQVGLGNVPNYAAANQAENSS